MKTDRIKKYLPAGALGISLLVHLAIFLSIGGVIIIQATTPKTPFTAVVNYKPANLPPAPDLPPDDNPSIPDTNAMPDDPQLSNIPLSTPINVIASAGPVATPNFSVIPSTPLPSGATGNPPPDTSTSEKKENSATTTRLGNINPFGNSNITRSQGLVGYFYDFKVSSKDNKATGMDIPKWQAIMKKFMYSSTWNTNDFKDYYRSPSTLGTTKFFITTRPSVEAPKAFNVPNKPALWCVLYQGKVVAPEDGTYRFVGFGDDLLSVRVNDRISLDGGWVKFDNVKTYPNLWSKTYGANSMLRIGNPFTVKAGETIKLDILIGDQGGMCAFYLFIQKDGVAYEKLKDGTPKLPIFSLDNSPVKAQGETPPNSGTLSIWSPVE